MQSETDFPTDLRALESSYELIREIGRGGMAAVYLARLRDTGRFVAIKAVSARYVDDPDTVQRFAREARTVADLDHPNIVRTEAIEAIADRAVAIIMEYVPGGTVRDRLREFGAFSAEHAESVLRDVASALGYAHRRGIVHRDVKPENVFLDQRDGRALLSDFGIARRVEGDVQITMLGAALGTPQYMSPEQIDGAQVDGRSDIYSLGVLGWELLTGRRPWAGESLYGIIYKQKHEDLPRITTLRPRVPANLLFAIEGALEKDRDRRWQNVDEFLAQLTYNPPPVVFQPQTETTPPVDTNETVQFRRMAAVPLEEPNDSAPATPPVSDLLPADLVSELTTGEPRAAGLGGRRAAERRSRRGMLVALGLIAPLAIVGVAGYALFGGRTTGVTRARRPADTSAVPPVTSSAGSIALDTNARTDTSSRVDSITPTRDSTAIDVPPTPPPATTAPKVRCGSPSMEDQRACLLSRVDVDDAPLRQLYDSLIVELRRAVNVQRGAPDPSNVRVLKIEQRIWTAERYRECTRDPAPGYIPLWAEPMSQCFARMSADRRRELTESLDSLRREPR